MPKGTRVHKCADKLKSQGKSESSAIAICQKSTGQSYKTGRKLNKPTGRRGKKHD